MSIHHKKFSPLSIKTAIKFAVMYTCIMILIMRTAQAQQFSLTGQLKDIGDSTAIKGATVTLRMLSDSSNPRFTLSDNQGRFVFKGLSADAATLEISMIAYQKQLTPLSTLEQNQNLGVLYLKKEAQSLTAITVVSTGPAVTQKDDTSQYNAKQFKTNPDATSEDLVKKMPGISVDKNGAVTAQGEQVKKVTVDGKEFFGDDVSAALKNIPANAVDKIQVYDRLSDQAMMTGIDDGNSQKAINIITKAGINDAQFGRLFAGYGTENRYSAGGNATFFKGERRVSLVGSFNNINQQNFSQQDLLGISGNANSNSGRPAGGPPSNFRGPGGPAETFTIDQSIGVSSTNAAGINYADKYGKWGTIAGSYFFNNGKNSNLSDINNEIFGDKIFTNRNNNTQTNNTNHRINARLDVKLDSMNMLFIIPSLSFQQNAVEGLVYTKSFNSTGDSLYNAASQANRAKAGYNLKNNIMFRHSFKKKNRIFSMSLNTTLTKNNTEDLLRGNYRYYDAFGFPIFPDSIQNQMTENMTDGYSIGGNLTYNEPLDDKGKMQLQLEYNPSMQKNKADQQTMQFDGNSYKNFDSLLSNRFDNQIVTQNGGLAFRYTRSKDEMVSVSVNVQHTQLSSDRTIPTTASINHTFINLLPFATWRKKISSTSNFRMFMRANTTLPTIAQLQDVPNLSNPLNVTTGNKDLVQAFFQFIGGRYTYTNTKTNKSFFFGAFFQNSNNYITNATYIAGADSVLQQGLLLRKGSQLSKPVNLSGYRMLRSFVTFSLPMKPIKSTLNLNSSVMFYRLPGRINQLNTYTNNVQYNLGLSLVSNVSEYVDYNISYNANINNAKTKALTTITNNFLNQSVSVVFNLLSKKGWFLQNDLNAQFFNGLSGSLDTRFILWNAGIGKKFFKDKTGEIRLSVFDLLRQNRSLSRNVTNTFIEDTRSNVIGQYFMLSFGYNLKNFGKAKKPASQDEFLPKVGYPGQY
jgi:hypothetical protein